MSTAKSGLQYRDLGGIDKYITGRVGATENTVPFGWGHELMERYAVYADKLEIVSDSAKFGQRPVFRVDKSKGDLIGQLSVRIRLPALPQPGGGYAGWTNAVAFAMFDKIEFLIDTRVVSTLTDDLLDIRFQQTTPTDLLEQQSAQVGYFQDVSDLAGNALVATDYFFNLPFPTSWERALPVYLAPHSNIEVKFYIKSFAQCITCVPAAPALQEIVDLSVYVQYISVPDAMKAEMFPRNEATFLYEQYLTNNGNDATVAAQESTQELAFKGAVKVVFFILKDPQSLVNNDWLNYSAYGTAQPLLEEAGLVIDGLDIRPTEDEYILRTYDQNQWNPALTSKYIYQYTFSDFPWRYQPGGGTWNFSLSNGTKPRLRLKLTAPNLVLKAYAISYNALVMRGGRFTVLYA